MAYFSRKLDGSCNKCDKSIKTRNMKSFSEETFLRDISAIDWEESLGSSGDAYVLVQQFRVYFPC